MNILVLGHIADMLFHHHNLCVLHFWRPAHGGELTSFKLAHFWWLQQRLVFMEVDNEADRKKKLEAHRAIPIDSTQEQEPVNNIEHDKVDNNYNNI
jgi:hypothetical protein